MYRDDALVVGTRDGVGGEDAVATRGCPRVIA